MRSARPLRIGILTEGLEERELDGTPQVANGGVGVYIYNLVAQLRRIDAVNHYVTVRMGGGGLDIYAPGPNCDHVALPRVPLQRLAHCFDWPYARLARRLDLDLLHYPNQFGGVFLPRRTRRVMTLHDITPLLFPAQHPHRRVLGYRALLRRALGAADHVIVDAQHTAGDLLARGLTTPGKLSVIPLGVGEQFRPGVRSADLAARYDLPDRYILTVGVLEPRKNHICLLRALRRLHQQGEMVGVVIVGREGWRWRDPLGDSELAALRPWVRVYRNVPDADLPELYGRAAVFAYPSLYEGFGLPVVEAMACGTPVVASRVSSLPEVVGDAALLADPRDSDDFADKLLAVLRDASLHDRLRAAGEARSRQLSWRRMAEQTLAVYERVCGRS
jgi:glycosyltransferase involved in cell wall biosynthesis